MGMAEIQPFKTVHYNENLSAELGRLITPPYDIISPEEQEGFYQAHPSNIIRLVLGKQVADDSETNNRYTRAGTVLKQWLQEGTLVRDDKPGILIYEMEFDQPEGGRVRLDGIVCLVKVDEYGKGRVLPHEKTYKGPKQDQLNLMRACGANITPIHGLFSDDRETVHEICQGFMQGRPDQETVDADGTVHRTWTIYDEAAVSAVAKALAEESIFIADGHHRYETAMAYRNEIRASGQGNAAGPHDWVMMYLTSLSHPGLVILPAHRMVKGLKDLEIPAMLKGLEPYFHVEELSFTSANEAEVIRTVMERISNYSDIGGKFGMVVQGESCFRLLRLKDFAAVQALMDESIPPTLRGLDVTILREIIMGRGLSINGEGLEGHVEYAPVVADVLNKLRKGEVQIGFILNPTRVDQVRTAAELGHKLPHKSTYFYPKISSGLVLHVM
jgi:uncharacterized protein (DUF1015 family)